MPLPSDLRPVFLALGGHLLTEAADLEDSISDLRAELDGGARQRGPTAADPFDLAELENRRTDFESLGLQYLTMAEMDLYGREGDSRGRYSHRGPYGSWAKSRDFFTVSMSYPDRWFRSLYRVSRKTFDALVALIGDNPVFQSTGKRPQRPVKYQLACYLIRYGSRGADTMDAAQKLSLGHGTVFLYCARVVYALRCLRHRFVQWPTGERKQEMKDIVEELSGIPGVIGIVDGSLIPFARIPKDQPHLWFTRKKFAGANIQATVDYLRRFTSYDLGTPGSVPDVTIFKQSHLWLHRPAYFGPGEIILADKGYPCSPYTLRPFAENELGNSHSDKVRRRKFNKKLSGQRIEVEHAFGDLKGRFPSLKMMGGVDNLHGMFEAIESMMILHNICIELQDKARDIPDFTLDDEYPEPPPGEVVLPDEDIEQQQHFDDWRRLVAAVVNTRRETDDSMKIEGRAMRLRLLNQIVP